MDVVHFINQEIPLVLAS